LRRPQRREQPAELRQRLAAIRADRRRDAFLRAEQIAEHPDTAPARLREEQRRPALGEDTPRNLRDLEGRVDGRGDGLELAATVEMGEELAQISEDPPLFEPDRFHEPPCPLPFWPKIRVR
jgi:hypothetical protein